MLTVFLALRKKLEVTLDYIKSIGRKIQSFINFNISFKFVKVKIRSCCKAERPFIRLRFIPQQTHWWRRQEKLQSCEDGPKISGVLKPNLLQLPIHIHSRLHSYIFVDSIDLFFNCLNFVNVAVVGYFLNCFQIQPLYIHFVSDQG